MTEVRYDEFGDRFIVSVMCFFLVMTRFQSPFLIITDDPSPDGLHFDQMQLKGACHCEGSATKGRRGDRFSQSVFPPLCL